ncbi:ABC transporter substrate-binding protein [Bacillus sp. FSL K6-3431]|uniref:ABC transporter substrate-binding protein n=1 Tax=Bacillus sp. FSL K6-3431 TaxID=2921500 RepID=UPI0030F5C99B
MKKNFKFLLLLLTLVCSISIMVACNNSSTPSSTPENGEPKGEGKDKEKEPEPVTLSVLVHWEEEMFNERFKNPIEEAFPHITLEHVRAGSGREDLEELFAKGTQPDILFEVSQDNLEYLELDYDLGELIEKHNYDLSHINPVFLDSLRAKDKEGRLLGLPYEIIYYALFYNKDIFDLFGQPYPTDNMTWDEAIELAKKVTGERNGVNYRGLDLANPGVPLMQLAVNKSDPETGEVLLDQPEFSKYLELIDKITATSGSDNEAFFNGERFATENTTAMLVEFIQGLNWWQNNEGLNDAVAPLPVWADGPAVSHRPDGGIIPLSISPYSEQKDAAFDVITYFTENEYQTWASRNGIGPSSGNTEVLDEFFQGYESTHDKNVSSIFNHPPADPPERISLWDSYVDLDLRKYVESGMDRNEFLRVTSEEAESAIQEAMNTK